MGLVGRFQVRLAVGIGLALAVAFALNVVAPSLQPAAHAQEGGGEGGGEAAPGGQQAAGKTNLFWHIVKSAGIVFGPLLLLISIGMVALIVLLAMDLRLGVAIPPGFVEEFTDTVNKMKFKEAFDMARNDNSYLARVMTAGMARLQYGIEDAREAAFNMSDSIKAGKEQLIAYLATIGTLGPLLGLVGTVFGMILAFMELGRGGTPNAGRLADGISHALVVTLLGVSLAVPAIFCHSLFKNRLVRIAMDVQNIADDLLTQMYHNSKRPGAAPANAQKPAPAGAVRPG
jgi:biopolymer transport protein ExbB